jgi:hypothetical protein
VHYVGYDAREAIRAAIECIDRLRRGEERPETVVLDMVTESDNVRSWK